MKLSMTRPSSSFFDSLETRSPEQRESELLTAIRSQLDHAKRNTRAYSRILADFDPSSLSSLAELSSLPVTRKSALLELQKQDPPFGGFAAIKNGDLAYVFSSPGPIYEPQTRRPDYWRFGRALFAAGMRGGDLIHNSFSYHLTPAGAMFDSGAAAIGATVIPGGVGQTEQQLESIVALKPVAYSGTPSFLKILLEKADESGLDVSSITNALMSGEAFPQPLRDQFSEAGISAVQCYGTADLGLIAYESSAESGLILDEHVHVEIVRPGTGDPVTDGEVGEVVVTTLNPDYPLIRFATGDMSAMSDGVSACGRTNRRIKGWMGRADQTAKVRGMFIHPEQVARIVDRFPEVERARLRIEWVDQADVMRLICEVENGNGVRGELAERVGSAIREQCKVRGEVELVAIGTLPRDGIVIEDARKYD